MQKWEGGSHHLKKVSEFPCILYTLYLQWYFTVKTASSLLLYFTCSCVFHMLIIDWEFTTDRNQLKNYIIAMIHLGLAQHGHSKTYAGRVDAAPGESLWVCARRNRLTDKQVDRQTDGRTPVRCITLTARLGLGNNRRIRYDTVSYFNVRSRSDMSQLYLPRENKKINKKTNHKTDILRSHGNSPCSPWSQS